MVVRARRPLKANDPDWPVLDLDMPPEEWKAIEAEARRRGIPSAVLIRLLIEEGLTHELNKNPRLRKILADAVPN